MRRRSILQRLAGAGLFGLGGCVGTPGPSTQTTASPPEDLQRRVSITEQDTVPAEAQLSIGATVRESTITESHTAQLRVTITNAGPARGIPISTGKCALFNRYSQTSNPQGVWLGLPDEAVYVTQTGPQWIAEPPENGAFPDYGCSLRTYEPNDTVYVDYGIFQDSRTDGYLDAGNYRFVEDDILITPSPSAERDADDAVTFSWGFSIDIENPN